MALSPKMLMTGEENLTTTRTHVKVLFLPFVLLLAVVVLPLLPDTSFGPHGTLNPLRLGIVVVLPVIAIFHRAFAEGWGTYVASITDPETVSDVFRESAAALVGTGAQDIEIIRLAGQADPYYRASVEVQW